jgi:hypothetical protein
MPRDGMLKYSCVMKLGEGAYGDVTLVEEVNDAADASADPSARRALFAMKKLKVTSWPRLLREVATLQRLRQEADHVIQLREVLPRSNGGVLIVMEYVPLNLREYISAFRCDEIPKKSEEVRFDPPLPLDTALPHAQSAQELSPASPGLLNSAIALPQFAAFPESLGDDCGAAATSMTSGSCCSPPNASTYSQLSSAGEFSQGITAPVAAEDGVGASFDTCGMLSPSTQSFATQPATQPHSFPGGVPHLPRADAAYSPHYAECAQRVCRHGPPWDPSSGCEARQHPHPPLRHGPPRGRLRGGAKDV